MDETPTTFAENLRRLAAQANAEFRAKASCEANEWVCAASSTCLNGAEDAARRGSSGVAVSLDLPELKTHSPTIPDHLARLIALLKKPELGFDSVQTFQEPDRWAVTVELEW